MSRQCKDILVESVLVRSIGQLRASREAVIFKDAFPDPLINIQRQWAMIPYESTFLQ